jgi:MerR family transcriptional regulator/heat shock protein HspR
MVELGADRALYSISVAAEVTGVSPQMLRVYEQRGLLTPHRTDGGTRRFTSNELDLIREIAELVDDGFSLNNIGRVLQLQAENDRLQREVDRLAADDVEAE